MILESVGDGIGTIDRDGRVVYANESRGAGSPGGTLRSAARSARTRRRWQPCATGSGARARRATSRATDGTSTVVDFVGHGRSRTGEGATVMFRDVSNRARAERRLAGRARRGPRSWRRRRASPEAAERLAHAVCSALGWEFGGVWLLEGKALRMAGDVVAQRRAC